MRQAFAVDAATAAVYGPAYTSSIGNLPNER